jgi:hypothetical protein
MDDLLKCKLCGAGYSGIQEFSGHMRKLHKLSQKDYFEKIYTKLDLFDESLIEFKSYEQYLMTDFSSKANYKIWAGDLGPQKFRPYFENKLKKYCELKNSKKAPSYVESGIIKCLLPIDTAEQLCDDTYNNIAKRCGLSCSFDYTKKLPNFKKGIDNIIIDTREQKPFKFNGLNTVVSKIDYGDYALSSSPEVSVERKSLSDFLGTMSGGFERFEKEIVRAGRSGGYVVVITESPLNDVLYQKRRFGKCSSDFISHKIRLLMRSHSNIQFIFAKNRPHAEELTLKVLQWGNRVRKIDLQYFINKWL